MPLKRFEFLQQFVSDTVLIKSTQFEKIGPIGKFFIPLGNMIINFHFRNKKSVTFFVTFTLNLERNLQESKFEPEQILGFSL